MEAPIDFVTHDCKHRGVAMLALEDGLTVGETVHIAGHTTDCTQTVFSMAIDHRKVETGGPGAQVTLHVVAPVRSNDAIDKGDAIDKVDECSGILVGFGLEVA